MRKTKLGFGEREGEGGRGCRRWTLSEDDDETQAGSTAFSFLPTPNASLLGVILDGGFERIGIDGAIDNQARSDLLGDWGAI